MRLLHAALFLPLLATNLQAGGLVPAQIDAKARWIGHLDLQGFHDSQVYQALLDADEKKEIERGLSELFNTEGIDLFRDVRGATIYGTVPDDKTAVCIIDTVASIETAIARWREKDGAKTVDVAGHACTQWHDGEDASYTFLRTTGDTGQRQLVCSKTKEGLAAALEVLEGKRASLATQPAADINTTLAPGTFAFFTASGVFDQIKELQGESQQSAVARMADGLRVEIGELGGQIFVDARLRTKTAEDANRVQQIVQGLMALASFAGDEPEIGATLGRWIKAVQINRQDRTVQMRFDYHLKTLIAEMRALEALKHDLDVDVETGPDKK